MAHCPVCFDDAVPLTRLTCGHSCCAPCLKQWFETEETTGQLSPTCPVETCRLAVEAATSQSILGRAFVPAGSSNTSSKTKKRKRRDSTTQQWLDNNTIECGGCQTPLVKSSGCDKLQCLCGFRICWKCKTPGARCQCSAGHLFLDNVTGMPSIGQQQLASKEELQDMKGFLNKKKKQTQKRLPDFESFYRNQRRQRGSGMPSFPIFHSSPTPLFSSASFGFRPPTSASPFVTATTAGLPPAPLHPPNKSAKAFNTTNPSLARATQISLDTKTQLERDLERAMLLSLLRTSKKTTDSTGNTASNPVLISDDSDEEDRKPPAAQQSGKSASDPVCLDSDDDQESNDGVVPVVAVAKKPSSVVSYTP